MNATRTLDEFFRLQSGALRPSERPKIELAYQVCDVRRGGEHELLAFEVHYPTLNWRAVCDRSGISIGGKGILQWNELETSPCIDVSTLHRWLYQDRERLVQGALGQKGGWESVEAPGWFLIQLYNAIRTTGDMGHSR